MLDPKFETEVQQKMEELEFTPSELVWANLQHGLQKQKRRRAPLLWLFFLLGGIFLGAGGASLFYFHHSATDVSGAAQSPLTPAEMNTNTVTAPGGSGSAQTANKQGGNNKQAEHTNTPFRAGDKTVGTEGTASGWVRPSVATPRVASSGIKIATATAVVHKSSTVHAIRAGASTTAGTTAMAGTMTTAGTTTATVRMSPALTPTTTDHAMTTTIDAVGSLHPDFTWNTPSRLRTNRSPSLTNALTKSSSDRSANKAAAKKARFSNAPVWEAGFAAGGGLSMVFMPQPSSAVPPSALQGYTSRSVLQLGTAGAVTPQTRISKTQPDLSFWAGIFVQRPVAKRLALSLGLNLHYYSTRVQTGQEIASGLNLTRPSLFNASPYIVQAPAQTYPYYTPGDNNNYSNRYYFLSVPVSLQWQSNHSRKTPLIWEGGLSLSRLVSENALFYNEKSGVYIRSGGVTNPNHLMAFSSLMIGLAWKGNLIKLGPEAQYGLTSLINSNSAGDQHLFYGGIKIMVVPKKW